MRLDRSRLAVLRGVSSRRRAGLLVLSLATLTGCVTEPSVRFSVVGRVSSESGAAVAGAGIEVWRLAKSPEEQDVLLSGASSDDTGDFRIEADVPDPETWDLDCTVIRLRVSAGATPFWHALAAGEEAALCDRMSVEDVSIVVMQPRLERKGLS